MGHNWSGWPGAYCTKCGAEQALENALALNWYEPVDNVWSSEEKRQLVQLCDNNCSADMSKEDFKKIQDQCKILGDKIGPF